MKTYLAALAPVILFIGLLAYILSTPPQPIQQTTATTRTAGELAPDFTLKRITPTGLTQETFTLSSTKGNVVFMDFVFSWCPYCSRMAPTIKKLHDVYSNKGVFFLTITGNDERTNEQLTAEFLKKHEITWMSLFDEELQVFRMYSVPGTPTYYVLDRDGRVVGRLVGAQSYEALAQLIEKALSA